MRQNLNKEDGMSEHMFFEVRGGITRVFFLVPNGDFDKDAVMVAPRSKKREESLSYSNCILVVDGREIECQLSSKDEEQIILGEYANVDKESDEKSITIKA